MEEQDLTCPNSRKWLGKTPQVFQAGSMRGILERQPGDLKSLHEVEGSLSLEQWETQWKEFLRTAESLHSPWGVPSLSEKLSPWEDAKAFLASFEQVAEACQWPQEEWVTRLLPALRGEAKWAFNCLDVPDREDFGKVKAAILREDVLSREKKRQHFRGFGYQETEGPRGAYRRLWEMCRGWLRVENHSKEQILEVLVLEQLLNILPSEIQSRVRESGPESCFQAVVLAEEFLLRQEALKVHLEETAGSISETGRDPSESEWKHLLIGIKEEEGREANPLAGSTDEKPGELQRSSLEITVEEDSEENYSGIKRKEGIVTEEKRDKPIPFRGGGFHKIPVQEERPTKKRKNEELCSKQRIHSLEKENGSLSVGKSLMHKKSMVSQEQIHSGEKPYSCLECGKGFTRQTVLTSHQRIHSGGASENEKDKELHGLRLGMKGNFRNEDCPKRQRGNHLTEKKDQPYPCQGGDFCEVIHMEEKTYRCWECGMDFSDQAQYYTHLQKNSGKSTSGSGKNFSDGKKDYVHVPKYSRTKAYKCFQCGKYFRCKSQLLVHQRRHTGKKPFECSECGKKFSQHYNFQMHQRTHTGEKPFECSGCGKKFSQLYNLQMHQRIHTGEKPFECSGCGKKFSQNSHFQRHQRTHTGEKPFECSGCGKKFSQLYNLQIHQRTHTGEKPFECSGCGKKFSKNYHLQRHQIIHRREKLLECSECGKRFSENRSLQQHQRIHRGEKPFECSECEKSFKWSSELQRHQRTHIRRNSIAARPVTGAPFIFHTLSATVPSIQKP